jgi:hypothetical protein
MTNKYSVAQYSVDNILGFINSGEISIPEIQRPFVWNPSKVRDLIDSLYSGYPTGYLIIWQNPTVRLKDGKEAGGTKILIDGQQRVTALMTALAGQKILTEDYETKAYKIAFNPLAEGNEERFAVQTPVHVKSKNWIADISVVFKPDFNAFNFINEYMANNPEVSSDVINKAIQKLLDIRTCQMGTIILVPDLDINEVTEIFVRINSQGKRLNESDFAMSKIAADSKYGGNILRKAIDYFCHLAVDPIFYEKLSSTDDEFMQSEFAPMLKWLKDDREAIYDPDYNDMLRVCLMHKFGRGKLKDLVNLLSGRDFETRTFKEEIAENSFNQLTSGVKNFMNEYNFKNFVLLIKACGFINEKLLNSKMTLDFAYTLYLILNNSKDIDKIEIKRFVQKWFVLSTLTSRYIGSPESQMDRDLRNIEEKGFRRFFAEVEEAELSDTFWNVGLVQNLETSSINSPYFNTFIAAQVWNAEQSLFSSTTKVSDLVTVTGDVHHIFPKEFLKQNGYDDKSKYNQVANYTYLDTTVNISVGKQAPSEYFTKALEQCHNNQCSVGTILNEEDLKNNLKMNCIPEKIFSMQASDYDEFLLERRKMMAEKIKKFYYSI